MGNKIYYPLIFFPEDNVYTEKGATFLLYLEGVLTQIQGNKILVWGNNFLLGG